MHQGSLDFSPPVASLTMDIHEAATFLGVSTATIRNWIKAHYLEAVGTGQVSYSSVKAFQKQVLGKDKLNQRANKSLKDSHDHEKVSHHILQALAEEEGAKKGEALADTYEQALSDAYRNKEGVYYTPPSVVEDLFALEGDEQVKQATFCDPCCGSGNFIMRALALGFKPENIYGYDVDPVAVEITKARIYAVTGYRTSNIQVADFLTLATGTTVPQFDYIFTNPPWGKKIPKKIRVQIGESLKAGTSLDTSALFLFASLHCLKEEGRLGLLLPESFFNIAVFEQAREKLLTLSIARMIDYGKVFKGLLTKAQGVVLKNQAPSPEKKIRCEVQEHCYDRTPLSFACNPKSILNFYCDDRSAETLQYLMSLPHMTLKGRASWGLGIVTGNNKKFVTSHWQPGYLPVYKGSDIQAEGLKEASCFIPNDMGLYQQVAPLDLYQAKEKLIYKFISSRLCFFYDDQQRFILNSANLLIPDADFPVPMKLLGELLSSDLMNWIFTQVFNTHKVLRGDLEVLPIHYQCLEEMSHFDESLYLERLNIQRCEDGTYRIKA